MFQPPTQYCPRCKQWVALDRSQHACAQAYACDCVARGCPLAPLFDRRAPVATAAAAPQEILASWSPRRIAG